MTEIDVSVNLLWLAPGRVGGSEQYLVRQLAGLPAGGGIAPRLFCQSDFVAAYPELAARFAVAVQPLDRDWRGLRLVAEHTWLAARARHSDVIHHGGGTVPVASPRPILLTIHDLQYLRYPHYFSTARRNYLRWMMPRSARRAAVIATPSGHVRDTVIDAFGVPADRVVVVPHGVPTSDALDAATVTAVRERFGVADRPYVIYPSITHPHKGHAALIRMLVELDDETALVLIGGTGTAEAEVHRLAGELGVADRVRRLGRVTDGERDALIAGAEVLVFPSEYEGFGAPLVEAMDLGTPIVCSGQAAVREVVGEAAVIVDEPMPSARGEAFAAGVRRALARRDELVAAGRARRREFTLEASGAALQRAYRQAVLG